MSLLRAVHCRLDKLIKFKRFYGTPTTATNSDEYTETPQYPEILDTSRESRFQRLRKESEEQMKAVKTVEEKQIKLNMPKYYGYKCYMFEEDKVPYSNLELVQHVTRTHLIQQDSLPSFYDDVKVDDILNDDFLNQLQEVVLLEHELFRQTHDLTSADLDKKDEENLMTSSISNVINRLFVNNFRDNCSHLSVAHEDQDSRVEAFWFAGGMNPPAGLVNMRKNSSWFKEIADEPVDRPLQYIGKPSITLRSKLPLRAVVPYEDADEIKVPTFKYCPETVGVMKLRRRAINTPGYWPGDPYYFGLISYHNRAHLVNRTYNDTQEALCRQGILASFGWLVGQANMLGFTTVNDVTYPLVNQCIITNGKLWSFFVYQLNTMLTHSKEGAENPKQNYCWATKEMKLFEGVENGKLVGFNMEIVKNLAKFYANAPCEKPGVELRPYLSKSEKVAADYEDDDKRGWLENEFKQQIATNRPHHLPMYEIFHWEKIYKVDHKTRPRDPRRKPFETNVNPWKRTYDNRLPKYIPRALRPDLPRHKGRYVKEYFP